MGISFFEWKLETVCSCFQWFGNVADGLLSQSLNTVVN